MNENTGADLHVGGRPRGAQPRGGGEYREFPGEQIHDCQGVLAESSNTWRRRCRRGRSGWGGRSSASSGRRTAGDGAFGAAGEGHPGGRVGHGGEDHVVVTVSLGVLKAKGGMEFNPSLPSFKREAIGRLGFGVVNKLFMEVEEGEDEVPSMELAFEQEEGSKRHVAKIPWWMRRTASICPIYGGSRVLLSWFAGKEAAELEKLS
ncbi:hypothetical protein J5N97_025663 [Dioscorea zingiberensis]|uniref:Amine oxidase domain-containing protein n=1 Tax=Dioscorea zingiberensis TaxID=325984 RepID=A0A9D5C163_9LILI|nr:hypothetical protein J5N97_025663 [Dioscorea zingiberensis]